MGEKIKKESYDRANHVVLTSHLNQVYKDSLPIKWGEKNAKDRGPVIATILKKKIETQLVLTVVHTLFIELFPLQRVTFQVITNQI